jgi:ABC-type multidrug transport system fused ATPase/permease subunit
VGLLLGWQRAADGVVLVDGAPLDGLRLEELRRQTAWVDPTVQLWNRTFLENLLYGSTEEAALPVNEVIEMADLLDVLERLPDGLQTLLGEGGALVSGGQGQRVRVGRAMMRSDARLVILDEPFRGLERERRREMLARARALWHDATLICITHDVASTQTFSRAVVIHEGEAVEDDSPVRLAAKPGTRYRSLLEAEEDVRVGMWSSGVWRRLSLQNQRLSEDGVRSNVGV